MHPSVCFQKAVGSPYPSWTNVQFLSLIDNIIDFRGRTPKKLGMDWSEEKTDYLALSALNVKTGYIDFSADPHYGDEELYEKWMSGNELRKGQVLFTTEAPMGNVAQVPDDRPYILSQRTIAFDVDEKKIDEGFLAYLLLSPKVQIALSKLATGGTATGISQKSLAKLNVTIPSSLEEQQKIADFLSSVDEVISTSEQEVANLEMQKKAVMKKIFSQEVRFKKDDGTDFPEWEYNPFEEIARLMTASIDPSKAGKMHCVELEHLEQGSGQRLGFVEAENQSSNKRLFETGDVLFGKLRPYLRKYWVATEEGCCSTEIWVLRPLSGVLSEYLLAIVSSDDFISVANTSEGTKMPRASWDLVANAEFPVPSFEEQRLITDFLSNFDEAIAAAKKELELWKELKKGLLQQLFV